VLGIAFGRERFGELSALLRPLAGLPSACLRFRRPDDATLRNPSQLTENTAHCHVKKLLCNG
jgi:hypothetical protein